MNRPPLWDKSNRKENISLKNDVGCTQNQMAIQTESPLAYLYKWKYCRTFSKTFVYWQNAPNVNDCMWHSIALAKVNYSIELKRDEVFITSKILGARQILRKGVGLRASWRPSIFTCFDVNWNNKIPVLQNLTDIGISRFKQKTSVYTSSSETKKGDIKTFGHNCNWGLFNIKYKKTFRPYKTIIT